jgi:predicted nucleic acid-binding protein
MTSIAIVDAGPLIASANAADPDHARCLAALQDPLHELIIPALCVAEAAHVLGRRQGPRVEAAFLRGLTGFAVEAPRAEDWERIAQLVEQYADFPLGGADAALVALAERYDAELLITLDRRHFSAVRPRHREGFRLLP